MRFILVMGWKEIPCTVNVNGAKSLCEGSPFSGQRSILIFGCLVLCILVILNDFQFG